MNIQEYIQSGIIESYVLGIADADEVRELNNLRMQYPELEQAIRDFEQSLEASLQKNSLPVSPDLKKNVFQTLALGQAAERETPRSITVSRSGMAFRWMAAASVVLLVGSASLNIYMYSRYKKLLAENDQLAIQRNQLFAASDALQTRMQEMDDNMQAINGDDMLRVSLSGVPGKTGNEAIVYWSKTSKDVYISVKKLPAAPVGKQYQLWALLDGKPINAGMLGNCGIVCKLKNIPNAQAFAITLERSGGSATPSLDQLYVMGKI